MDRPVNLTAVLREEWRTPEGVERMREAAAALGLEPTTAGQASLSFKAAPEVVGRIFGVTPRAIPPSRPGTRDFGAPGGYGAEEDLAVPEDLRAYVESISIIPPARRLK